MQGNKTGTDVLKYRYGGNFDRFGGGAPEVLYTGPGQAGKDIARGLEQRRFEKLGGLNGTANAQKPHWLTKWKKRYLFKCSGSAPRKAKISYLRAKLLLAKTQY